MKDAASVLDPELQISPRVVLAVFTTLWLLLAVGAVVLSFPQVVAAAYAELFLLVCALAGVGWVLAGWKPLVSRWFTVLAIVIVVHLASRALHAPTLLTLVAPSIALAAPLISFPAAVVSAVAESLLLGALLSQRGAASDGSAVTIAVMSTWATISVMYAVYRPIGRLRDWVEHYFRRAQVLLEQARDRQAELKQILDSLAQANRRLALANERMAALRTLAEEAQRAKTAFVSSVSHEFRTPLNMIIGLVELMVETPEIYSVVLSPKMREDLEVVYNNCEHLARMINDVLDLTRMEAGRLALQRERVDLKEIVDSSVKAVRPLLETKQLGVQLAIPADLPAVYCDRVRVEQVILNLVSNAARFTETGGITLRIMPQNQHVVVSVRDTGPGIASGDIERIFEPFWQAKSQVWHDKGGSGLGLSISRDFVKLHGGRMWLESKLGAGSTFFFSLPVSPPMEHVARPGHPIREDWIWREDAFRASGDAQTFELLKPRIVLCDRMGVLFPRFARYSDDVEFVDTRDPAEVMSVLQECPVRAVLLNTAAPGDLWPLVDAIRQLAPGTPVIGCAVEQPLECAVDAGALGYLIKPVMRADLEKALAAVGRPVRRVLVVDDDRDVLRLFDRMLHVCDSTLEISTAASGEEALAELRRELPDLMLLDIVMPGMDGWQVLEAIAGDDTIKGVQVYLVSAQDPSERPLASELCLATMKEGISLSKLLRLSLEAPTFLLEPEPAPDPRPG